MDRPLSGEPYNLVYSKSNGLTRREDIMHNNTEAKGQEHFYAEKKTFSTNDAVMR